MSKLNINFNNKNYTVIKSALSEVRTDFISHLGTIAGEGLKLTVDGVEYSVDPTKLNDAMDNLAAVLDRLASGDNGDSTSCPIRFGERYSGVYELGNGTKETGTIICYEDGSADIYIGNLLFSQHPVGSFTYSQLEIYLNGELFATINADGTQITELSTGVIFTLETSSGDNSVLPITWNSDAVAGNPSVEVEEGLFFVKISDKVLSAEDFSNAELIMSDSDSSIRLPFGGVDGMPEIVMLAYYASDTGMMILVYANTTEEIPDLGIAFPEVGLYAMDFSGYDFDFTLREAQELPTPEAPPVPTVTKISGNYVVLSPVEGCEYSIDGSTWQSSFEFYGLSPETEYTFYMRYKATATHNVSESSSITVRTSRLEATLNSSNCEKIGYTNETTELIIPEFYYNDSNQRVYLTGIDNGVFEDNTNLTSVSIPNSVTSIGYSAFEGCTGLTSITIPNSVTSMGHSVFNNCSSLTSITFEQGCQISNISGVLFMGCSSLTNIVIPNSVTSIGDSAFRDCSSLTSITIPDSVTSIGRGAFYNCSSLTSITIPNGVTSIEGYVFYGCSSLTNITIPDGVTSIGDSAFGSCSLLTSITIPDSVTSFDQMAFHASGISAVYYKGTVKQWCQIQFNSGGSNPLYENADLYINGIKQVNLVIPNGVTEIKERAFDSCKSITNVTLPNGVTHIHASAFAGCNNLRSVTLPSTINYIGSGVFFNCVYLYSITFEGTVDQWNAVTKENLWNYEIAARYVQCSDGQVAL